MSMLAAVPPPICRAATSSQQPRLGPIVAEAADGFDRFTLHLRLGVADREQVVLKADSASLVAVRPLTGPLSYRERRRFASDLALSFTWRTTPLDERVVADYRSRPERYVWHLKPPQLEEASLMVQAPVDLIGPGRLVDLVVLHDGIRIRMYVDGVLIDEEFPCGPTRNLRSTMVVEAGAGVEAFALWDQALSEAQVVAVSGGVARRDARAAEIHPAHRGTMQYWRPAGYNASVGDCMPVFHDGVLHIFYLFDRRHHLAGWGLGKHTVAHLSTRDLRRWRAHPVALDYDRASEGSIGTGTVLVLDGIWHLTWIEHARRCPWIDARHHADNVFLATSRDGERFTKHAEPLLRLDYGSGGDINTCLFRDPEDGLFYQPLGGDGVLKGLLEHRCYRSADLRRWTPHRLDSVPALGVCPSYLHWRGFHYLFACGCVYLSEHAPSRDAFVLQPRVVEHGLIAPMLVPYHDDRALMVGFCMSEGYGGRLVIRELVQDGDGTLAARFVPELMPTTGEALSLADHHHAGPAPTAELRITEDETLHLRDLPDAYLLRATVAIDPGGACEFVLRASCDGGEGLVLRIDRETQLTTCHRRPGAPAVRPDWCLDLPGMHEGCLGLEEPFSVEILVVEDLIDSCIAGRYPRIAVIHEGHRDLIVRCAGGVTLHDCTIRPLTDPDQRPLTGDRP